MRVNSTEYRMVAVTLRVRRHASAGDAPAGTSYGEATWMRAATSALVDVITTQRLRKPVVIGHFLVGSQIAVRLAAEHPGLVGGLIIVGGEPMRGVAPSRPRISQASRAAFVDTALAPKWFKTVTNATFDTNNYRPFWYSKDSARAAVLWKQSSDVPLAVMIRYLCEYTAIDTMDDFARIAVNTRILIPGFRLTSVRTLRDDLR
jgi:pimeloyl-ACP methyl ester carboxylesterase